jgi:deoxyribodipyrimidine photolyase
VNTALKIASLNDNELMKNFIKKYDDDIKTDNPNMYGVFEEYYNLLTKPTPPQIHYSNPEPEPESESEPEPESESESEPESEPSDPSEVLSPEEIKEANNEEELYEEPE